MLKTDLHQHAILVLILGYNFLFWLGICRGQRGHISVVRNCFMLLNKSSKHDVCITIK